MSDLFEMLVLFYVLCPLFEDKTNMVSTVVTWRKFLAINTSDLMFFLMVWIMNDSINPRSPALITRLEDIASGRTILHGEQLAFWGEANVIP
jgi:hypothetical protein